MIGWTEKQVLGSAISDPVGTSLEPAAPDDTMHFVLDFNALLEVAQRFDSAFDGPPGEIQNILLKMARAIGKGFPAGNEFVRLDRDSDTGLSNMLVGSLIPKSAFHPIGEVKDQIASGFEKLSNLIAHKKALPRAQQEQPDAVGRAAIGIVDVSIAFLNRRFRKRDGTTRFEMLWIPDRKIPKSNETSTSKLMGAGAFLLVDDINDLIRRHTKSDGYLDEEAAYREFSRASLGHRDTWQLRGGHGTSILDHLAGAEPGEMDDERPIYAVELPTGVFANTSGSDLLAPLLSGISAIAFWSYVLPWIYGENPKIPLVLNASLAFTGGPDDPKNAPSLFSHYLNELMSAFGSHGQREIRLTLPVGNHLQDRIHAELKGGQSEQIDWVVPPDDRTSSVVEIYQEAGETLDIGSVKIVPPGLDLSDVNHAPMLERGEYSDLQWHGEVIGRLARSASYQGPDSLIFKILPTAHAKAGQSLSPAGIWSICLESGGPNWLLWVRRDDTPFGFVPAGRQSRFLDGSCRKFDRGLGDWAIHDRSSVKSKVRRDGTSSVLIFDPGTSGIVPVAGTESSWNRQTKPYRFGGRSRISGKMVQDVAEESRVKGGPMSAGRNGRSVVRVSGTSIASALHARTLADQLSGSTLGGRAGNRVVQEY